VSEYCVKFYEDERGLPIAIEAVVHYQLFIFVRVTDVRVKNSDGEIIEINPERKRSWVTTSGIGWFRLGKE